MKHMTTTSTRIRGTMTRGTDNKMMRTQYPPPSLHNDGHHHNSTPNYCHEQLLVGWGWRAIKQGQQWTRPLCHEQLLVERMSGMSNEQCFTVPHLFQLDSLDSGESVWILVECRRTSNKRI